MSNFLDLMESSVGCGLARQLALAEYLGSHEWELNTQEGRVSFGRKRKHAVQILGTENTHDNTFMWAWANTQSGLPESVTEYSRHLHDHGNAEGIPELCKGRFRMELVDGHAIALACSGLVGRLPYYRGPYDGGAVFFYVLDTPPHVAAAVDVPRATHVIQQLVSGFDLNHERAVAAFLVGEGLYVEANEAGLLARWPHGDELRVKLDQHGRVAALEAQASQPPPAKKPWWKLGG
ncbi:MAG: hypothetical protein R3B40_30955 [Polyangiales bacterium]|nr:hypothetical protein [Myxococcales bacterium]MCB9657361.1 hypothetical protein [Sandaracinaceae bacterium]